MKGCLAMRGTRKSHLAALALGGLFVLGSLALVGIAAAGAITPQQLADRVIPTPQPPSTPDAATWARMKEQARADMETRLARGELKIREASGPATRGNTIVVASKSIRLPDDAWIEQEIATILCGGGRCPQAPVLVIRRGNSTIIISAPSGTVHEERVRPGEENAFQFLKDVLR